MMIKKLHVQSVFPQEDVIAQKEKSEESSNARLRKGYPYFRTDTPISPSEMVCA
jgi:hypothetical protein